MKAIVYLCSIFAWMLCSCSRGLDSEQATGESIPAGDLRDDDVSYQFAIYYLPQPTTEPIAVADALVKERFSLFKRADKIEGSETVPTLVVAVNNEPHQNYAPPDPELLQRFGYGMNEEQAAALQATQAVVTLDFFYSKDHTWDGLRSALKLTSELAQETGGLIWDETTRETFSPDAWDERRIAPWTEPIPDVRNYIVIHAYPADDYVRAITLGMSKFALPDIVIERFPWSLNRSAGLTLNLLAQAIAEQPNVATPEKYDLVLKAIQHPKVREEQLKALKPNATGVALLSLETGTWEEGDPDNRLIEIKFHRGTGPDIHSKREQVLAAAFGWEDTVTNIEHNEELLAASRAARTQLPGLRADFEKGLAPGEFIQVKAPFDTPDGGQEWMWVEVTSWQGDKITGLLNNEPHAIPTLKAGQVVEVSEEKVFDYIRKHANGTVEGNETAKVIRRMQDAK